MVAGDTITMIMEMMTSLHVFGNNATTITQNIKRHLLTIKEVAERIDVIITPDWLTEVSDVITDLQDLLEDHILATVADPLSKQSNMASSFLSLCNLKAKRRSLLLHLEKIEKRIQQVAADSHMLKMKTSTMLTNSVGNDGQFKIVGREGKKEEIINNIFYSLGVEGAIPATAIYGIRGIGKTTLAKFVFDDERVISYFDLVIWIDHIHDEFYADSVVERMVHEITTKKQHKKDENLNLGEALGGSSFFLVLDDLQSENREEWLRLKQMLIEAAGFSDGAVLVTTQNSLAANVVEFIPTRLSKLGQEDSWALFEQVAGGNPSELKTRDTLKKMVEKCRGIPLAIVTLARMLMSCKGIDESEIDHLEEEFMQEMQLIYYNALPSLHLKQCFAYLSFAFSTTFLIHYQTLIRLWTAEGFLGPINFSHSSSHPQQPHPEDLGLECIQEFLRNSIFCVVNDENSTMRSCYVENRLMMELSEFVAGKDRFNFSLVDGIDENVKETVRRVSLTPDLFVSKKIPKPLTNIKSLHAIFFPNASKGDWTSRIPYEVSLSYFACDAILCTFKSLRVLNLADLGMKMLPISIGELKRLKYLDLSLNNMKKLPKTIGKLKNLQTLILSQCHQLKELPYEMKHLVSLRHLEMEGCMHLTHMPSAILKKLPNLQTLSCFVVSSNHNRKHIGGIEELVNLNNLRGGLEISHLERLKFDESEQDGHDYLKEKQHLERLTLKWNHDDGDNVNDNDSKSLKHLKPHQNLQVLSVVGYGGKNYSGWFLSLENLVDFTLYNCPTCESLPPLDKLPKLKTLTIQRLDSLKYITDQDQDHNELGLGLLKHLSILDCPNLTSWWKGRIHNDSATFASLQVLELRHCPKLDCMPLYPNLDFVLELAGSSLKPLLETITCNGRIASDLDQPLSKLHDLTIQKLEKMIQSPLQEDLLKNFLSLGILRIGQTEMSLMKGFKHLVKLQTLQISDCKGVDLPGDEWEGLQSLNFLELKELSELNSLPEGIKNLSSVTELRIQSCPELRTLTEGISHMISLKSLWIEDCHKLASLPKGLSELTSLSSLTIRDCPLLLPRCQEETGDDWPQIKNVQVINLYSSQVYED